MRYCYTIVERGVAIIILHPTRDRHEALRLGDLLLFFDVYVDLLAQSSGACSLPYYAMILGF